MSNNTRGRRPQETRYERIGPDFSGPMPADLAEQEAAQHLMTDAYNDDRDLVNQLLGQAQMAKAFAQFSETVSVSKLAFIKENKLYRVLKGRKTETGQQFFGTWDEFCELLGCSRPQTDEDIKNLRALGEQAVESMSRMGIGYRELRQFRRLPDDSRQALIAVAETGDKEALLDLAEDLIARQRAENEQLDQDLDKARKAAEDATANVEQRDAEISELKNRLNAANRSWAHATPDEQTETLLLELRAEALQIEVAIRSDVDDASSLRNRIKTLLDHGEQHGRDHHVYLAGLIAHLERCLWRVRDEFHIPMEAVGDPFVEARRTLGDES